MTVVKIRKDRSANENFGPKGGCTSADTSYEEYHYRIGELAALWHAGRETLRVIFAHEPGVVKIRMGRKQKHTTYLIPASVAARVHLRLTNTD